MLMKDISRARQKLAEARYLLRGIREAEDVNDMLGRLSEELGTLTPRPGRVTTSQNIYYNRQRESYRVDVRRNYKRYVREFSVRRYRSIDAAYEAARKFREDSIHAA